MVAVNYDYSRTKNTTFMQINYSVWRFGAPDGVWQTSMVLETF